MIYFILFYYIFRSTKLNYGDKTEDLIALGETHNSGRLSMPENNEVSKVPPRKSYSATNCQPGKIFSY